MSYADQLPFADIPEKYVFFKPLREVDPATETPRLVCLYANPDQLSALVVLANYGHLGADNVVIPFSAGCHTICLLPYRGGTGKAAGRYGAHRRHRPPICGCGPPSLQRPLADVP